MEAPQNIQQLPKTEIAAPATPRNLLLGSLIFLFVAAGFYLFCAGYQKVAASQVQSLDNEIQDTVASLSKDEVQKVLTLDAEIKKLKVLLPGHVYMSHVFDFLEKNTSPKITFTSMNLDTTTNILQLAGTAPTLTDVSLQAAALKQDEQDVRDVVIHDIGVGRDGKSYTFKLDVYILKSLLISQ